MTFSRQRKLAPLRSTSVCRLKVLLLLAPLFATSCTNEALFNAIQQNQLQRCETIPIAQQATCKQQFQTSYEEYRSDRDRPVEHEPLR